MNNSADTMMRTESSGIIGIMKMKYPVEDKCHNPYGINIRKTPIPNTYPAMNLIMLRGAIIQKPECILAIACLFFFPF